ncbi:two-component flavin-dependent monooxygenase/oxygenase LndZ5 [Nocardia ignorata]|uniref:Two-component flavin-dependent monooxygenase/oxygenase LndZ5 n=1 Tax=Nocardia ignorata TaxID=145285 RepID=A0A4R6PJ20_NOCIG|nr:two-component flavin-dependent monooxygenase/oxygenase LndZ5 [Nocardia ignorata]
MTAIEYDHDARLTARAFDVAELAADRAEEAESARTPDITVVDAVVDAGFARHFAPPEFAGAGGSFTALARAAATVGARCPATAWCAVLAALMTRGAGALSVEGQRRLWGDRPDVLIAGGVLPKGIVSPGDGGWILSGVWPTVSACECADWVLLAAIVESGGEPTGRICLVPQSDIRIERTWDSTGMLATGSHTVVAEQLFVPASLTFPSSALTETDSPPVGPDGRAVPMLAVNSLAFSMPILGAARGALRLWQQLVATRDLTYIAPVYARASSEIDAAGLILERVAYLADTASTFSRADVVRNRRDCAFAAGLLVDAVDRLFRASGSGGHSTSAPLQRLWRDVHTAGSHAALQFGPIATAYTQHTLGTSS